MNVHTPERGTNESVEDYKERRKQSKLFVLRNTKPERHLTRKEKINYTRLHFLHPNLKDTKHTRAGSTKRKGAL